MTNQNLFIHLPNKRTIKTNTMENNSVRFYHIDCINGEWIKKEKTSTILDVFRGGVLVQWEGRPQGKCIATENIIEINYNN